LVDEVMGQEIEILFEFDDWIPGEVLLEVVPKRIRSRCTDVSVNTKRGKRYRDVSGSIPMVVGEWNDHEASQFSLWDPGDRSVGLSSLGASRLRGGTRLSFSFVNPGWSESIFVDIRELFVSVVEKLSPRWGIAGFWLVGTSFGKSMGSLWSDNMHLYTAPRYDWLQVYQPGDFIDVSALAGSACEFMQIGDCRVIVAGPTPVVALASRDAVRAAVVRSLPIGEHVIPGGTIPLWHRQAVLGTEEGGLELPDELQVLTGPLRP